MNKILALSLLLLFSCVNDKAVRLPGSYTGESISLGAFNQNLGHHTPLPSIKLQDGWLGADAVYSLPLKDGRTVWSFGDSFVHNIATVTTRRGSAIVNNSLGIQNFGESQIKYFWRRDKQGKAQSFFISKQKDTWYWPVDSFEHDEKIYTVLKKVKKIKKVERGNEVMSFKVTGMDIAVTTPTGDNPLKWAIHYAPMSVNQKLIQGASIYKDDRYAYFFTLENNDLYTETQKIYLTRSKLGQLKNINKNTKYMDQEILTKSKDKPWAELTKSFKLSKAKVLIKEGFFEGSFRYHSGLKKWIAISSDYNNGTINLHFSTTKEGPWSKRFVIYNIPDRDKKNSVFYAAKEHIQFSKKGKKILISYMDNAKDFWGVVDAVDMYYPRFIEVDVNSLDMNEIRFTVKEIVQ